MEENQLIVNTKIKINFASLAVENPTRLYLLLHGYGERGSSLLQQLSPCLPGNGKVLAPNGPFPLPSRFPLNKGGKGKERTLINSFAWYFYNASTNNYEIDYQLATTMLQCLANHFALPVTIIGYSQGGYLAFFAMEKIPTCDHIVGLNCSFREDLLETIPPIRIDAICGKDDEMIGLEQAQNRHQKIIARGGRGTFYALDDQGHSLGAKSKEMLKKVLRNKE